MHRERRVITCQVITVSTISEMREQTARFVIESGKSASSMAEEMGYRQKHRLPMGKRFPANTQVAEDLSACKLSNSRNISDGSDSNIRAVRGCY